MGYGTIFFIAMALALDAFAVALTAGFNLKKVSGRQTFRLAFHFGLFQAMMNFFGWAGGVFFRGMIDTFDHWIAFALLLLVGSNMILGGIKGKDREKKNLDPTRGSTLVMLSVATSIDSLAVGLGFALLQVAILLPALTIGAVAAAMTAFGLHLGRLAGTYSRLGAEAEILGGMVLVAIGVNILHSHGVF
jgi:putative Mn2+ efflux pump MntP